MLQHVLMMELELVRSGVRPKKHAGPSTSQ
jgi:hypothetical protein